MSTAQGAIIGTVRYMAPEQLCDSAAVSPGTDVYALGAILYECLTGKALCDGRTVQEVMYRVMNGEPVPLDELAPTLPKSLVELVHGCLERSPSRRPPSATALALRLAAFSPEEPLDGDTLPEQVATAAVERRATSAPRMALLAGASLLFGALLGWGMRGARVGDPVEVARLSRKSPAVRSTAVASPEPLATLPIAVGSARSDLRAPETPTPSDSTAPPRELAHRGSTTSSHAAPRSPIDPAAPTQSLSRFDHTNPYGE